MPNKARRISRPLLRMDGGFRSQEDLDAIRNNLSGIVLDGEHLWLGGDEGTALHRLTRDAGGNFGEHKPFDVGSLLDLPDQSAKQSEIDIEGLALDDEYVWLVGSHSLKREKINEKLTAAENRKRLATTRIDANRHTLARVPLNDRREPVRAAGSRTAARLKGDETGDLLTRALADDAHVGPFCSIPSKDNGLDIEGLAVRGDRVFLGLRGPVLRGWAIVLELSMVDGKPGVLKLAKPLRKHFLDLGGLGIRDLAIREKDLFILAGPTMVLDGPVFIYQWRNALDVAGEAVVRLGSDWAIPFGTGTDHAEGMTFVGASTVMVCYDSPAKERLAGKDGVHADVFALE